MAPLEGLALPELVQIEPIHTCNLRCVMCHVSYERLTHRRIDVPLVLERLRGLEGRWVDLGGMYEPAAHPQFAELLQGLAALRMRICFITNGTLFSRKLLREIAGVPLEQVTISFDGASAASYERIRRRAQHARTLERVAAFKSRASAETFLAVNHTVLRVNVKELADSVDLWESMDFDHMGFIPMVQRSREASVAEQVLDAGEPLLLREIERAARRVIERDYRITLSSMLFARPLELKREHPEAFEETLVRSAHPGARTPHVPFNEIQIGHFPGMQVNCRSPFTAVRIDYDGNVNLCQSLFRIGNVRDASLIDLWYGSTATRVRAGLMRDASVCHSCDYYRLCVNPAAAMHADAPQRGMQGSRILRRASAFARRARILGPRITFDVVSDKLQSRLGGGRHKSARSEVDETS
jgi:radical SAM protein with 4Fe4S-binding SPASM domain